MKVSTLLAGFVLAVVGVQIAFGQNEDSESPTLLKGQPLDSKQLAREKFEAIHANLDELKQARFKAARSELDDRYKEFLTGHGSLILLHEAALCTLKSHLAVCTSQAERVAVLEDYWWLMHAIEGVNRARNDAARISTKDYRMSTYFRIDAEQRLRAAQGRK